MKQTEKSIKGTSLLHRRRHLLVQLAHFPVDIAHNQHTQRWGHVVNQSVRKVQCSKLIIPHCAVAKTKTVFKDVNVQFVGWGKSRAIETDS